MSIYRKLSIILVVLAAVAGTVTAGYVLAFNGRILPNVRIGMLPVGGLTKEKALDQVKLRLVELEDKGIAVNIEGKREVVRTEAIDFYPSPENLVGLAWQRGRKEPLSARMTAWISSPFFSYSAPIQAPVDRDRLVDEMRAISEIIDSPRKDIRFQISGTAIGILYDTKPGRILDIQASADRVIQALELLDNNPVDLVMIDDIPQASRDSVPQAVREAERMMSDALILLDERYRAVIDRVLIGSWIISSYEGDKLVPALDTREMSRYMTQVAEYTDIASKKPQMDVVNGKITNFVPPRTGRALEQDKTVAMISDALEIRRQGNPVSREIRLPVKPVKPPPEKIGEGHEGIIELIGTATTPFTGSPKNRISNIKNGVKFLSGVLLAPGEEFSTLETLGTIDNTTGYLPELVIKGDRTIPEFGGGLCQVSTTLFRSVLNSGMPVTARRNHSFRISYYEKDGTGAYIGPGLDATIYEPDLDFKFRNDTPGSILIYGYVVGDKVTFELYGTHDGRSAQLKGPRLLNEVPPGDPIYTETDTLPKGTVKQVEIPHPGATTIADYIVTYPDGRTIQEQFKSYYRRWPARFLIGTQE